MWFLMFVAKVLRSLFNPLPLMIVWLDVACVCTVAVEASH